MLHAAGVPEDVFVPVIGDGATGAALLRQPVDGVFFTGSYATGAKIAASAGRRMIKVAARARRQGPGLRLRRRRRRRRPRRPSPTARSTTPASRAARSSASTCTSRSTTQFVDAFVAEVKGVPDRRSDGRSDVHRRDHAPAAARRAAAAGRRRASARARSSLTGGAPIKRKGNWFAPTVLTDVDHSMLVMRDESFGPIIGIQAVADDDAAIELMNDTEYGLTAGVYTQRRSARATHPGARARRQRLLELLRSREPAAAVVGRQAFGHRAHAVDATASRRSRGRRRGT